MHRFAKVMGLQGKLVADPFRPGGTTPHFLGMRERVPAHEAPADRELHLADYYEPVEVIVRLDGAGRGHVLDAKAKGDLLVLGECVAPDAAKAALLMTPKPVKGAKGGE